MKIDTRADLLLSEILYISKISRLNENNKSILIEAKDDIKLFASSGLLYGQSRTEGRTVDSGDALIPLSIIPYLSDLGDSDIEFTVNNDNLRIIAGKTKITVPQIHGTIYDISTRESNPDWLGINIPRIKNLRYSANDSDLKMDVFWFVNNNIIASDRVRVCVYRVGYESDTNIVIPSYVTSYISPRAKDDVIDLAINDGVWLGDSNRNISVSKLIDSPIPTPILALANIKEVDNFVVLNRKEFSKSINVIKRVLDRDNNRIGVTLNVTKSEFELYLDDNNESELPVIEESLNDAGFSIKVNARFLKDAVDNSIQPTVNVGFTRLGNTPLLFIVDYDIIHYLIPLQN